VINDKESKAKQKAYYEKGVALSTVRITLNERPPITFDDPVDDPKTWNPKETFTKALKSVEGGAVAVIDALIFTAVWGVPTLMASVVLSWIYKKARSKTGGGSINPLVN